MTLLPQHPWQNEPTELIRHGIQHMQQKSDFDLRIGFLLLDVGVETLFKTYLQLPDNVTATKMSFNDRKRAAEGNFHELVQGVMQAAGPKLKGIDLQHVQFYHNIRNNLYHDGNGIAASTKHTNDYALMAVALLQRLLNVDLMPILTEPEQVEQAIQAEKQKLEELNIFVNQWTEKVRAERKSLELTISDAVEFIAPHLLLPSFAKKFGDIKARYSTTYYEIHDEVVSEQESISMDKQEEAFREIINLVGSMIDDNHAKSEWLEAKLVVAIYFQDGRSNERTGHIIEKWASGDLFYLEPSDLYAMIIDSQIDNADIAGPIFTSDGFPVIFLGPDGIHLELDRQEFSTSAKKLINKLQEAQTAVKQWIGT